MDHATVTARQVRVTVLRVEQVAADVDVHQPFVVRGRSIDQPGTDADSGVVDQYVEAAEMGHRRDH